MVGISRCGVACRLGWTRRFFTLPLLAAVGLLAGCTGTLDTGPENTNGMTSLGGTGSTTPIDGCAASELPAAKRIVRLSFNQIANTIGTMINPALATQVISDFELVDAEHRAFPPLQSPREGQSITDQSWGTIDRIAQVAGQYVFDNFAALTNCGAAPTDECALAYLNNLAQRAYRRPLTPEEQARLTGLYSTALRGDAGATVSEAVQHGVYAILQSPQFLYRTEFGSDWRLDGSLAPYELASMLSYFLTDDAPDEELLAAAAQGTLSGASEIAAHVDRILTKNEARLNLEGAMISYFSYPNLETQQIQDEAFTGDMRMSMFHEAELFLQSTLWTGSLSDLLVSRTSFVNATLAPIYGLGEFPPPGAMLDADSFARIELPADRTGLLTQPGFLANRSRPDETSVVGRGLLVKGALLCTETPPPPESVQEVINMINSANPDASQRELADIRASTAPCNGCHATFDAYGLALDTFDVLGRYRATDAEGRPIDPSVTLPPDAGGGTAQNIVEVAQKLAGTGAFAKCIGKNLVNYALADVSSGAASINGCAAAQVAESFSQTDLTFSSLVRAVATSPGFVNRAKGSEGVAQ